jgi:carbonic anhydrase
MRIAMIWRVGMVGWMLSTASAQAAEQAPSHAPSAGTAPHWSYSGEHGPAHWGNVAPEDAVCGNGQSQSPIDLSSSTAKAGKNGAFKINYESAIVTLVNNGHTVQADAGDNADWVSVGGGSYKLAQFHFHTPSEHAVDGKHYPLEIHFVNKDAAGHIAVVGVFVREGAENKVLAPVFSMLPAADAHGGKPLQVDIAAVLPKDHKAYVYAGSLTTPPCTEGVQWIVLAQTIEMSSGQIEAFKKIFHDNHRPLQKTAGREVDTESY